MAHHKLKPGKRVNKVERLPNESKVECIDRAIPILIAEGMTPSQARAAADNMCDLRKIFETDKKTEKQRAELRKQESDPSYIPEE